MGTRRFSRRQVLQGGATGLAATAVAGARFGVFAKQQATPSAIQGITAEGVTAAIRETRRGHRRRNDPDRRARHGRRRRLQGPGRLPQGLRRPGGGQASEPVDADTVFQLASVSKPIASTVAGRSWSAMGVVDLGRPRDRPRPGLSPVRPVGHARGHAPRPALPPERPAGPRRRPCSKTWATTAPRSCTACATCSRRAASVRSTPTPTSATPRRRSPAATAAGKAWEDLAAEKTLPPAGHDQSTSSRFADFMRRQEPRPLPRPGRGRMGRQVHARARRPVAGRRGQLDACATWPSGCACTSAAARWTASSSSPPAPWPRPTGPRSSATPPETRRRTGPASTGWAGT